MITKYKDKSFYLKKRGIWFDIFKIYDFRWTKLARNNWYAFKNKWWGFSLVKGFSVKRFKSKRKLFDSLSK